MIFPLFTVQLPTTRAKRSKPSLLSDISYKTSYIGFAASDVVCTANFGYEMQFATKIISSKNTDIHDEPADSKLLVPTFVR